MNPDIRTERKGPRRSTYTLFIVKREIGKLVWLSRPIRPRGEYSTICFSEAEHEQNANAQLQEVAKKRTRRTVKSQRAIVGASLDVIKERRSMRPEARTAARQQAIKESKEKKQAAAAAKKAEKAKNATAAKGQTARQVSKMGAKGSSAKPAVSGRR